MYNYKKKHTKHCLPFEVQFYSRAFRQQWINEGLSVLDSFSPTIVLKTNQSMRYSDTVIMNKRDYMNNVLSCIRDILSWQLASYKRFFTRADKLCVFKRLHVIWFFKNILVSLYNLISSDFISIIKIWRVWSLACWMPLRLCFKLPVHLR